MKIDELCRTGLLWRNRWSRMVCWKRSDDGSNRSRIIHSLRSTFNDLSSQFFNLCVNYSHSHCVTLKTIRTALDRYTITAKLGNRQDRLLLHEMQTGPTLHHSRSQSSRRRMDETHHPSFERRHRKGQTSTSVSTARAEESRQQGGGNRETTREDSGTAFDYLYCQSGVGSEGEGEAGRWTW